MPKQKRLHTNLIALRRALITLRQAGELNLHHVHGEMNSLWDARETVLDFLEEGKKERSPLPLWDLTNTER